jgi:hypothetical protein
MTGPGRPGAGLGRRGCRASPPRDDAPSRPGAETRVIEAQPAATKADAADAVAVAAPRSHLGPDAASGSTWWAPGAIGWWTGVLFAAGSVCFALGAAPRFVDAVGVAADGVTFFVGSLFFTAAACLTYLQVAGGSRVPRNAGAAGWRHLVTWQPHGIEWWAAFVQLVGTVLFNVSTFDAMLEHLSASQADRLVWTPDAFGSICFLVASGLAWAEVSHGWWSWRPRSLAWLITASNIVGSIAFGASAVASHIVPASGQPRNVTLMNLGTFVGALCFLAGAVLLLPARTRDEARQMPTSRDRVPSTSTRRTRRH